MNTSNSEGIEIVKGRILDMSAARIIAAIRRKFPAAKVERVGDDIVIEGQEPVDAEFRAATPWVVSTVREALQ